MHDESTQFVWENIEPNIVEECNEGHAAKKTADIVNGSVFFPDFMKCVAYGWSAIYIIEIRRA